MASLIEQIFVQAGAGSADGAGFGDFYAKGKQLGQEQERINLAERQLAQQLAMDALQKTTMLQEQQINAAKIHEMLETQKITADTAQKQAEMVRKYANFVNAGDPESAKATVLDFIGNTPGGWRVPVAQTLLKDADGNIAAKLELAKLRGNTLTADQKNAGELNRLKTAVDQATASGDTAQIAAAKQALESFQEVTAPAGTTVYDPVTGRPLVEMGRPRATNASGLTQSNLTKAQQEIHESVDMIDSANRLLPMIDNETVGIQAFAGSWVNDRVLAQRFPNLVSQKRANAEVVAGEYRARMIRKHRSDSNITDEERKVIEKAFPGIESPIDSPARAKMAIVQARQLAAVDAIVVANKLGEKIPAPAALVLDTTELARLVKTGVISQELALKVYDARQQR